MAQERLRLSEVVTAEWEWEIEVEQGALRDIEHSYWQHVRCSPWLVRIFRDRSWYAPLDAGNESEAQRYLNLLVSSNPANRDRLGIMPGRPGRMVSIVDAVMAQRRGAVMEGIVARGELRLPGGTELDLLSLAEPVRRQTCRECDQLFYPWDIRGSRTGGPLCYECVRSCDWCGGVWSRGAWVGATVPVREGWTLCAGCFANNFVECDACHTGINRREMGAATRCHPCYMERQGGGDVPITEELTEQNSCQCRVCTEGMLRGYDADAVAIFPQWAKVTRPVPKDKLYCGVELEVEVVDGVDRAKMVTELHQLVGRFAIMKTDGSLNYGIEIVSMPLGHELAKEAWGKFLERRQERRLQIRSWNTSTCGMHIHMSRRGLTEFAIEKAAKWMVKNQAFCEAVAGRTGNGYAMYDDRKWGFSKSRYDNGGKYQALNVSKAMTVEYRLFRGTLNRNSFLRNVDFAFALSRWARDEASAGNLTVQAFAGYVYRMRKTYSELYEWMDMKGFFESVITLKPVRPHKPAPGKMKPAVVYEDPSV